jgi:transcriptional regulator with XRE-family HTH domain
VEVFVTAYQIIQLECSTLKQARKKLGLTQQQVADQARIHQRQYQRFENGERNLSSASFSIACRVLDVLQLDIVTYARRGYILSEENVE